MEEIEYSRAGAVSPLRRGCVPGSGLWLSDSAERAQLLPPNCQGRRIVGIHFNERKQRFNTITAQPTIQRPAEAAEIRVIPVAQGEHAGAQPGQVGGG